MDLTPYIAPTVTLVLAFVGFYGMVSTRLARMEQRIDDLVNVVEKHNSIVERTFKLESDMNTAFKHIDALRERDEKIESKIEKIHE